MRFIDHIINQSKFEMPDTRDNLLIPLILKDFESGGDARRLWSCHVDSECGLQFVRTLGVACAMAAVTDPATHEYIFRAFKRHCEIILFG